MSNLDFWEKVEKTNPAHTKKAKLGQLDITAINATRQIKEATSQFGMYGKTWGLYNINHEYMDINDTKLCLATALFKYPDGEFPISSSIKVSYMTNKGYMKIDDDFMKKIETDMTTKALSKLGFNTDVFMGLYDDNKYINQMKEEFNKTPTISKEQVLELVKLIAEAKTTMKDMFEGLKWKLTRLEDIQEPNFEYVKNLLNKKIEKQKEVK